jgi:hypothetical protein
VTVLISTHGSRHAVHELGTALNVCDYKRCQLTLHWSPLQPLTEHYFLPFYTFIVLLLGSLRPSAIAHPCFKDSRQHCEINTAPEMKVRTAHLDSHKPAACYRTLRTLNLRGVICCEAIMAMMWCDAVLKAGTSPPLIISILRRLQVCEPACAGGFATAATWMTSWLHT